jgi:diadenosine tetraphosphate (Ap4A) HIT family hydrolase
MLDNYYQAKKENRAPWTELVREDFLYFVFDDKYPVAPGHLLFVPKVVDTVSITTTLGAAFAEGEYLIQKKQCDAFNVGMNMGTAAGQTVMYPHVHLIPRRNGDVADPVGGVRGVIPGQANYKKPGYKNPIDK